MHNDNYIIVIKADKVPTGEHARRFNVPTINEVAILMVDRDIRIMRRNNSLEIIKDTYALMLLCSVHLCFGKDKMNIILILNK